MRILSLTQRALRALRTLNGRLSIAVVVTTLLFAITSPTLANDTPPTTPDNLVASVYSSTAGAVQWDRSSDDRLVVGYDVFRDDVLIGTFDSLSLVETSLEPGRIYRYTVVAVDTIGQRSGEAQISLTTRGGAPNNSVAPNAPTSLRAAIYSRSTAELFWDRSGVFAERYLIRRNGEDVTITDGTSYIDSTLTTDQTFQFEVIALNQQDVRSSPTELSVNTASNNPTDPGSPTQPVLAAPAGLRASVYSSTAAELFWDRASSFGLQYEVRRDGALITTIDGISYFDNTLESGQTYIYEITAIAPDGRRSGISAISVVTEGVRGGNGSGDGGSEDSLLTADNAESVLREVVSVANGEFLPQFAPIVDEEAGEMRSIFFDVLNETNNATAVTDYALIEGSIDEPPEGFAVISGGRYTCIGGGSAALLDPFLGEDGQGYIVNFDGCTITSTTLDTTVTLNGRSTKIPRAGRDRIESDRYENFSVEGEAFQLAIDGFREDNSNSAGEGRFSSNSIRSVSSYTQMLPDGDSRTVTDYASVRSSELLPLIDEDRYLRRADADITFSVTASSIGEQTLDVTIDLVVDDSNDDLSIPLPEPPIGQWQSGGIQVDAPDGSSIRVEPITDDPNMVRFQVGDDSFERASDDGFQVECSGSSGCQ